MWEVVCEERDERVRLTTGMLCVTINVEGDRVERQMKKGCAVCGIVVAIGLGNIPKNRTRKTMCSTDFSVPCLMNVKKQTINDILDKKWERERV